MRQASVLVLSQCLTVVLCHNTAVMSLSFVVLARHARLNTLDTVALCRYSFAVYGWMWHGKEVQQKANKNYDFCQEIFACAPVSGVHGTCQT